MRRLFFLLSLMLAFFANYALFRWMKWYAPSPRPFVFAMVSYNQGQPWRMEVRIGDGPADVPGPVERRRVVTKAQIAPPPGVRVIAVDEPEGSWLPPLDPMPPLRETAKPHYGPPVAEPRLDSSSVMPPIPDDLRGGLLLDQKPAEKEQESLITAQTVSPPPAAVPEALPRREPPSPPRRAPRRSAAAANVPEAKAPRFIPPPRVEAATARRSAFASRAHAAPVNGVTAFYPQAGIRTGAVSRSVAVTARINARGVCVDAKITRSSGFPAIDQMILKEVRRAAYRPAVAGGMPVETEEVFEIPVHRR